MIQYQNPYQSLQFGNAFKRKPSPTFQEPSIDQRAMEDEFPTPKTPESENEKWMKEALRLSGTKGSATMSYENMLKNRPRQEDYQPSGLTRAGAALSGFAAGMRDPGEGVRVARDIRDEPYNRARAEYGQDLGATGELANLERQDTSEKLKALYQARAMGLDYDKFQLDRLEKDRDYNIKQRTTASTEKRNDAYVKNLQNPDYEKVELADGGILLINRKDPKDRQKVDAKTLASYTAQSGRMSAEAATIQAGSSVVNSETNAGRLKFDKENQPNLDAYHKGMMAAAEKRASRPSGSGPSKPEDKMKAASQALELMYADTEWQKFIRQIPSESDGLPLYDLKTDDGSAKYKEFLKEFGDRINEALTTGRPRVGKPQAGKGTGRFSINGVEFDK
jgi:hypothetical protein